MSDNGAAAKPSYPASLLASLLWRNERWASVNGRDWPAAGATRHIVRRGRDTSLCSTAALPATLWRGNANKRPCLNCVARAQARGEEGPA